MLTAYITANPPTPQQYKDCEESKTTSSTGGFCVNTAETMGFNHVWCEGTAAKLAQFFAGPWLGSGAL